MAKKFNKEEIEIEKDLAEGNFQSVIKSDRDFEPYKKAAVATMKRLKKNKRINIRLSESDLEAIKLKAIKEGMPYQTLINSIIHKYIAV